jgi:hypothetical protein
MQTLSRQLLRQHDRFYTYETFRVAPVTNENDGTVTSGATGATNVMVFPTSAFEYFILGSGETLLAPTISATGLLCSLSLTNNMGAEYTQGITARSPHAYTVGTHACYLKVGLIQADVSGEDFCAVGFRKTQAYQTALDSYTDFACLNNDKGNIMVRTDVNNAGETSTDTTDDWADGEGHTLEVYVSAAGVASYKIDGAAPTAIPVAAFTFDTGDVIVPFFFLLHDTTTPGAVTLTKWECGLQT